MTHKMSLFSMTKELFSFTLQTAVYLKDEMSLPQSTRAKKSALTKKFANLAVGLSEGQLNKIMSVYMDGLVGAMESNQEEGVMFPYLSGCAEILASENTSWVGGRGLVWADMAKDESGVFCETRKKLIREVLFLVVTDITDDKGLKQTLRAIQQMERQGVDILTPIGTSNDPHYDRWRTLLPGIISFASEKYLSFHVGEKQKVPFGLPGKDITKMWVKAGGLWNADSPVMLHRPVRRMALAGGRLAYSQVLEMSDMSGLYFEFLETMENESQGPAGVLIRNEEDQNKYLQMRSMARKYRLTSIAKSGGVDLVEQAHIHQSRKMKM